MNEETLERINNFKAKNLALEAMKEVEDYGESGIFLLRWLKEKTDNADVLDKAVGFLGELITEDPELVAEKLLQYEEDEYYAELADEAEESERSGEDRAD